MERDQHPEAQSGETEVGRSEREAPAVESKPSAAWSAVVQRKIQRRALQRKAERQEAGGASSAGSSVDAAGAIEAAAGSGGQPVDGGMRARVEAATGADLSGVRVHTGEASATAADAISAKAYTVGQDVHFNAGQYQPGTTEGDRLIAHELVHTVQQGTGGGAPATKLEVSEPGDAAEVEADHLADAIVDGGASAAGAGPIAAPRAVAQRQIMRDPDDDKHKSTTPPSGDKGKDATNLDKDKDKDKDKGKGKDKTPEAKPPEPEAPAAAQGPSEIVLSADPNYAKPDFLDWFKDKLDKKLTAWGLAFDKGAVRLATLKRGEAEVKAVVLTWNATWGKQPAAREVPFSMGPIEAAVAVAQVKKLKGWGKVDPASQGMLEALLGGETNELSAAARSHLGGQYVDLAKKSEDDQAKALTGVLSVKEAVPDVVAEKVDTAAARYTLDGPTVQKNYPFRGRNGDAELYVAKFDDGSQVTIVSPKAMEPGYHNHSVQQAADAAAHLPRNARAAITTVMLNPVVNPDDAHWAVEYKTPDFHSYMTAGAAGVVTIYPDKTTTALQSESYMQGTMIHETGHSWSYQNWGTDTKAGKWVEWQQAMDADKVSVSGYAKNSIAEDVAESIQVYGSTLGTPKFDEYRSIVPKRFAMLDEEYTKKAGKGPPKASDPPPSTTKDSKDSKKDKGGSWF